ncbi:MAG: tRNA lysidine(34) synthetase TilS [Elainellaceae cyanobacterium]
MPPPWSSVHARLHQALRQRQLLPQGSAILVAVSGGQDSLALTKLLLDLQRLWGWTLAIAHCDHGWRPDSADNAAHVAQLAQTWGLPCHIKTVSKEEAAVITSEAAARDWRYRQLAAVARAQGCAYVVTGHTASDRAETLLYNLIRGSGADGLQALSWCRELGCRELGPGGDRAADGKLWLVRPMLDLLRQETAQICTTYGLPIWEDETNQDLRYTRNRIRQQLLPYLESSFNPAVEQTLAQTAEVLQADVAYLESQVDRLWLRVMSETPDLHPNVEGLLRYGLRRDELKVSALALQRRLLRRLLLQVGIAPTFRRVEALAGLIDAPNRTQTSPLYGGIVAQVEGERIIFKMLPAGGTDPHPFG